MKRIVLPQSMTIHALMGLMSMLYTTSAQSIENHRSNLANTIGFGVGSTLLLNQFSISPHVEAIYSTWINQKLKCNIVIVGSYTGNYKDAVDSPFREFVFAGGECEAPFEGVGFPVSIGIGIGAFGTYFYYADLPGFTADPNPGGNNGPHIGFMPAFRVKLAMPISGSLQAFAAFRGGMNIAARRDFPICAATVGLMLDV